MAFLQEALQERRPRHVAIIMDGNGRWARSRGLSRLAGHSRGVEALRRTVAAAVELGLEYLTVFAFSSENWERPAAEVDGLMGLLRRYLRGEVVELHEGGVRLRFIGELTRLPDDIKELITDAESLTASNQRLVLTVALNYGSRREFVQAVRRLAADAVAGRLDPQDIGEREVGGALFTAELPDPDLIIRTGGERRMSNFLLWQAAYSEFVFLDKYWPDFTREDLEAAIREFHGRQRRYGMVVEAS
jgi:undecaprenyl diphosphate synthase